MIGYTSNIGHCPVCSNPVTNYAVLPETSVYEFAPCGCWSQTWTIADGKFVGGSSRDWQIDYPKHPQWQGVREAAKRILAAHCGHDAARTHYTEDAMKVAAVLLEAIGDH